MVAADSVYHFSADLDMVYRPKTLILLTDEEFSWLEQQRSLNVKNGHHDHDEIIIMITRIMVIIIIVIIIVNTVTIIMMIMMIMVINHLDDQ